MKASLKFREDQKPLIRAKIPLNILGFPFQSGIETGDSKDFCLNLSTFFESGPSLKLSYRPNDPWKNPFSIVVKTGIGAFGSPISAPLSMSAEFNLAGSGNPSFFLQFKPHIGDFSLKKSATSSLPLQTSGGFVQKIIKLTPAKEMDSDAEGSVDGVEMPLDNGVSELFAENGEKRVDAVSAVGRVLSGVEFHARTVLPVRNRALLKCRWGVRFPPELKKSFAEDGFKKPEISFRKIPFLVMSKISFEHVPEGASKRGPAVITAGSADVVDTCLAVKRQMEVLRSENGSLRKAVEELRSEFGSGKKGLIVGSQNSGSYSMNEKSGGKNDGGSRRSKTSGYVGNTTDGNGNDEIKNDSLRGAGVGI